MAVDFAKLKQLFDNDEFMASLKSSGAEITGWCDFVPYSGEPLHVRLELRVKTGLFSSVRLAVGNDEKRLETMARSINANIACKWWKLRQTSCSETVMEGDYTILSRIGLKGGERQTVTELVSAYGGTENEVDYLLNESDDTALGHFLIGREQYGGFYGWHEARALANIMSVGSQTPISVDEGVAFREAFVGWAKDFLGH